MTAQHSSKTDEHGTPPQLVELMHATIGLPDVDPASSPAWNRLVRARRVITKHEGGLSTAWFDGAPKPTEARRIAAAKLGPELVERGYTVGLNPPGEREGMLVAAFWLVLDAYFALGWCRAAIWIGFNIEQLARLQRIGARTHPLMHVTVVPAYREGFRPSPTSLATAGQPTHSSYVTLLTRDARQIETFQCLGSKLGHVINGNRR